MSLTAYATLNAAEAALNSQAEAQAFLVALGFKGPKAQEASIRWWRENHPVPPASTTPPFLVNKKPIWTDRCDTSAPVENGFWSLYPMGRVDGVQESSTHITDIKPGRFERIASGGPHGEAFYQFYSPQGDNIWTPGSSGRSELSYPRAAGHADGRLGPHPDVVYFMEGQRYVTLASIRLPAPWDVSRPSWRALLQMKQSEWEDQRGLSPALALEERSNNYIITNFGGPIIWSTDARAGQWLNFAFEVKYSPDPTQGEVIVHLDKDLDGNYEYTSDKWMGKTLADNGSLASWMPSTLHTGCYEGVGGDTANGTKYSIWT